MSTARLTENEPATGHSTWGDDQLPGGIPPRAPFLSPGDPLFLGTPQAESLTSYFTRVAAANHLTAAKIFYRSKVSTDAKWTDRVAMLARCGDACFRRHAVSIAPAGAEFAHALADLTGRPSVRRLHWGASLDGISLIRLNRVCDAWCTECLQTDRDPYHRVLWETDSVTGCDLHGVKLTQRCPSCHRIVKWGSPDPVRCRYCGHDRRNAPASEKANDDEIMTARAIGEFIAAATAVNSDFRSSGSACVSGMLAWTHEQGATNLTDSAELLGLRQSTLSRWQDQTIVPSLVRVVEIALRLEIPIQDLCRGTIRRRSVGLRPVAKQRNWCGQRLSDAAKTEIIARLKLIASQTPPVAPRKAAVQLGVNILTLRRLAPDVFRRMAVRHEENLKQTRLEKWAEFTGKIEQYITDCSLAGRLPDMSGVRAAFPKPGIFLNRRLYEYAQRALADAAK